MKTSDAIRLLIDRNVVGSLGAKRLIYNAMLQGELTIDEELSLWRHVLNLEN